MYVFLKFHNKTKLTAVVIQHEVVFVRYVITTFEFNLNYDFESEWNDVKNYAYLVIVDFASCSFLDLIFHWIDFNFYVCILIRNDFWFMMTSVFVCGRYALFLAIIYSKNNDSYNIAILYWNPFKCHLFKFQFMI